MPVERIVVRAPNPLGDAVMAIPAMAALRAAFRDRALVLAAAPAIAPLFNEITPVAPDAIVVVDRRGEAGTLRELRADCEVLFPNSFRTAWAGWRAGIPERWGYRAHGRSPLLTRAVRPARGRRHQADFYRELVRALGFDAGDALPTVRITEATARQATHLLESLRVDRRAPLVGMAPGAAYGYAKRWPPARFAELIVRLNATGAAAVLVGADADRGAGREIESSLPAGARVANLIARTDLRLLAGVLAACDAFVSNDSGAMHLAAAAGVPVAAVFGPTDERRTAPLGDHDVISHQVFCRPCMLRECPIDHRCMRRIGVDRVFAIVATRLEGRRAGPAPDRA